MRKIIFLFLFIVGFSCFGATWFEKNKELSVVFSEQVWKYIEKANYFSNKKDIKNADYYLRKAKEKTENSEPFTPQNWPFGWPRNKESLKYLKYSTPTGFIYRIIGDFCLDNGYIKEAIKYFEMYIGRSVIPDSAYYIKLAELYEKEKMFNQAINLYKEVGKFIENKNYWGKDYSLKYIESKIKNLNFLLRKNRIIVLKPVYIDIPSGIQGEFFNVFLDELRKIKNGIIVSRGDFEKVLNEQKFIEENIEDEELSIVGKILNTDYVLKPSLTKVKDIYIFNVDVFSVNKKNWFEHYEYKIDEIRYIPNLIKRFVINFQGEDIPFQLYLPETKFLWSYETDSLITDLKFSKNGEKILVGCESGSVYLLNKKGLLLKSLKMAERIVSVSIAPTGDYFSLFTLEGKLYFFSDKGNMLWVNKTGNLGRGIGISENGRFITAGVDKKVFYIDRNGEIFWDVNLPDFISSVAITDNSRLVFIGTEKGTLYCYRDDGNLAWRKEIREKIINLNSEENYLCVETDKGKVLIFDLNGNEIKSFKSEEEVDFNIFATEILNLISGKKGNFLYFLSYDKKSLWKYLLRERIVFLYSIPDGSIIVSSEGKNIFTFSIIWK
ncbi:MAG: PQQ-binding-like beta-propeller repeat protein [Candidatus Omnitrophica bacterium]|nr:PQQ-binding-like beta-propeller repeat protein [Candidatus Omnitrophota bacterium]